ncbi:MAG: hypothetical protein UW62_C0010G0005 [Candidatus Collierbacteria bacterium GW2011_GWB1_44_35]|uniref:YdhG-like domain-containing protein n=5 Tax=Candidatus Collieribacteriota TaxID=1752725 RepID=A0A0G1JQR7_9BACT|nr:MAG: hypothetical protein UW23_C0044G0006 [Candidatus Collierbacteria bacterium GW2011_GWA1_44_12]KKT38502.1 MAG: hypothetical protein UW26_C0016G0014 [Candidatus Collierbacteria bacterium GW2011_GWF1_44_12]KKT46277.1 MAG: hypothetical protein UW35_C0017G0005 [Candidatus Collierbacteria bacterium GW2011_GWF2_44_15]KKT67919.1 MAG: hypothetical protein UW62_C0010G0005 [Candidatus Collierbacteria bacterium GW2011_GWB1_44_35]KKU28978.1 MAG: hypothetical protein UX41_C0024G0008 [Candidatus Collie
MRNYIAEDVDAYIASSSKEARPVMEELRKIIKSTIPEAEEGISWGVPFYKYRGLLGGFAVFKDHISFGLAFVLEAIDRETLEKKGYMTGKKTVQIKFEQKVPTAEIKKILKAKAKMNEVKGATK